MAQASVPKAPAPISTPISDTDRQGRLTGYVPVPWSDYFNSIDAQLQGTYLVLDAVRIPSSSAAVPITPITNQVLPAGLYRVTYYVIELQADNVASSFQLKFSWKDRGTLRTIQTGALTANSILANGNGVLTLRVDRSTPITYEVLYSSTGGAPKMIYSLDITLEQVQAVP